MPELPDLEVFAANLTRKLAGKKVSKVVIEKDLKTNVTPAKLKKSIEGNTLKEVKRSGKELFFYFKNGDILAVHLMLHGKFYWLDDEPPKKNTLFRIGFPAATLALTDFQRQARLTLAPEISEVPDALSKELSLPYLKEQLQSRGRIKNILLDQHVIRGIGNAYADEILWEAGISPFSIANKIPDAKIKALQKAIPKILRNGIKQVKKASPDIIGGEIRDFLVIHNAKSKKSPGGAAIIQDKKGRVTYYTKEQELFN